MVSLRGHRSHIISHWFFFIFWKLHWIIFFHLNFTIKIPVGDKIEIEFLMNGWKTRKSIQTEVIQFRYVEKDLFFSLLATFYEIFKCKHCDGGHLLTSSQCLSLILILFTRENAFFIALDSSQMAHSTEMTSKCWSFAYNQCNESK